MNLDMRALSQLIRAGDIAALRDAMDQLAPAFAEPNSRFILFAMAMKNEDTAVTRFLLSSDPAIDVNNMVSSTRGFTLLQQAACTAREAHIPLLLEAKANPSVRGFEAATPLELAVRFSGNAKVVSLLLAATPPRDRLPRDASGKTALDSAIEMGDVVVTRLLLDVGVPRSPGEWPAWALTMRNARAACKRTTRTLYGALRKRRSLLASLDMVRLLARAVWDTRWNEKWKRQTKK